MRVSKVYGGKSTRRELQITSTWLTDQGKRPTQDDAYGEEKSECFILADGVGGLPHGALAAQVAVDTALWAFRASKMKPYSWKDRRLLLTRMFHAAHAAIRSKERALGLPDTMATTMAVLIFGEQKVHVGHCGDTVVYHIRNGVCTLLTTPDRENATTITVALGIGGPSITPHTTVLDVEIGDMYMVMTDGIFDWLMPEELLGEVTKTHDDAQILQSLFTLSVNRGSTDNMTAGIVRIE